MCPPNPDVYRPNQKLGLHTTSAELQTNDATLPKQDVRFRDLASRFVSTEFIPVKKVK